LNGIQDEGEKGVSGVKVTLNTGVETTTDGDGKYEFCTLDNGEYSITVDTSTLPDNYKFTEQNQGTDDAVDSDINPTDGKSDTVTIKDNNNTTLDGGIYKSDTPTYCLGDFIWYDDNKNGIQDEGEKGVSGVKVTLNTGLETTTDGDGKYEFCTLDNGEYSITVDTSTLPDNYKFTEQNQGTDDAVDSDINPTDGKSDTVIIQDSNNTTLDGGIYKSTDVPQTKLPSINIEKLTNDRDADTEDDATPLIDGDEIEWKYVVSNVGEETIVNIKVIDDREGVVECPETSLAPSANMICTLKGVAKYDKY